MGAENAMRKTQVIILAGGSGERFGGELPKQFVKIAGRTIIEHTIEQIEQAEPVHSMIIVINREFYDYMNDLILRNHFTKVKKIIVGGKTRQESSFAGLEACDPDTDYILFHDAIRPFVSERILKDTIAALEEYGAVDVAIPCADTIIRIDDRHIITDVPRRKDLMRGQTPQGFRREIIQEAYRRFWEDSGIEVTDDCGIVRHYGLSDIYVVDGEEQNIKITYKEDAYLADKLFQLRSARIEETSMEKVFCHLKEKTVVIFGASSGIGHDMKALLEEQACTVYGFSRRSGCDITSMEQVKGAFRQVYSEAGHIDYVVNTAGELLIGKLSQMSAEEAERLIGVDYTGAVLVTMAAIPYLRETKGSLLLFASSSYTRGRALYSIYSSAKAAVVNFAQAAAEELYEEQIRVNVISPERTDTPMRRRNFGLEPSDTLLDSREVAKTALRTLAASFTGQVIDVRRNETREENR